MIVQTHVSFNDELNKLFYHYSKKFIPLECKTYVKYLEALTDILQLTWKQHFNYSNEKISKKVGIIARLRHFVPLNTLQSPDYL